jgi:hypothetical protein
VIRVGSGQSDVLRTCKVASLRNARSKAESWRQTLLALSEFREIDGESALTESAEDQSLLSPAFHDKTPA